LVGVTETVARGWKYLSLKLKESREGQPIAAHQDSGLRHHDDVVWAGDPTRCCGEGVGRAELSVDWCKEMYV